MYGSLLLSSVVAFTPKYATTLPNYVISAYDLVYASESVWCFLYLFFILFLYFSNEVLVLVLYAGNNCSCPFYIITERYLLLKVEL
jgi:hypothetical protein